MAPRGQTRRGLAPAPRRYRSTGAVSPFCILLIVFLLVLFTVVGASSPQSNDVFLLLAAASSSAAPSDDGATLDVVPSPATGNAAAATSPAPTVRRLQPSSSSGKDADGGRRLLVLRPAADIRCYCNLPRCITTGYMCKSPTGVCFSDLADRTDVELATHGCIELLPSSRHGVCHTTTPARKVPPHVPPPHSDCSSTNCEEKTEGAGVPSPEKKGVDAAVAESSSATVSTTSTPLFNHKGQVVVMLLCCHSDMCNHIDSPEIRLRLTNDSLFVGSMGMHHGAMENADAAAIPALYFGSGHDGWFRVATIAVPICGAFILMVLIFVAFKILRRDSEDQKLRGGGSQRHSKQPWDSPSHAWDDEDPCLGHQCANTQSHLLPPLCEFSEDSAHLGAKVAPNLHASIPVNAKIHLLPPQHRVEAVCAVKKHQKLDYFFLFPRASKCRKQGLEKQVPVLEEKAEGGPTAVVVVSVREQV